MAKRPTMLRPSGSVLIVDDEDFIRNILCRIVGRAGFTVDQACDGVDALEKMREVRFDFVISDIKMPRMDGMGLLKEIKSLYPATSVLLVTAYSGEYTAKSAMEAGADDFITKPFKNFEIIKTLTGLSARRERLIQQALRQQAAAQEG